MFVLFPHISAFVNLICLEDYVFVRYMAVCFQFFFISSCTFARGNTLISSLFAKLLWINGNRSLMLSILFLCYCR